jgi:tritrans,polycis-undecaprenyl-diphosphate synthase [geranylgeranyl-diphosphate specific]
VRAVGGTELDEARAIVDRFRESLPRRELDSVDREESESATAE